MKFKPAPPIPENSRLKTITTGTAEVFKLDPRYLTRAQGFNTRYDFGDITALAADIEANGILEALKVRKDGQQVFIVNGDRRLTAIDLLIKENRWPEDPARPGFPMPVPCTSEGKGVSPTDRLFMMLSLNTGKPFNLLEKGYAYCRILDDETSLTASEVARRTGETKQAVSNAVTLIRKASPNLIELIKRGTIAASTASDITKIHSDHSDQDAAAADAIATASASGRNHATPKDIAKKPQKAPPADLWTYAPSSDHGWNEHNCAVTPNTMELAKPKLALRHLKLFAAITPCGVWRGSYSYSFSKGSQAGGGYAPAISGPDFADEASAFQGAWAELAPFLIQGIAACPPLEQAALRGLFTSIGNALHFQFVTGDDHDDSLFAPPPAPSDSSDSDPPFFADLSDEDDDENTSHESHDSHASQSPNPNAPNDPSAFDRLRNAPATNRDGSSGSGPSGGPGGGFAAPDKRLKNIEELLDSIDPTTVNQDRWNTVEMVLDYLNGNNTVALIRTHLTFIPPVEYE